MIPGAPGPSRPLGRWGSPACRVALLALLTSAALGCGGGAPLFHPAHVLRPGKVSAGAGMSGQVEILAPRASPPADPQSAARLDTLIIAPGVAPWVGARMGIAGDNEGGLTYTGRALRLDGRHAFTFGALTLSLGLGASAVSAVRPGDGADGAQVFGGGLDLPLLLGVRSASDLYAFWIGPRAGLELLSGKVPALDGTPGLADARGRHLFAGLVMGLRVGFRHVHAALELSAAYHRADGRIGAAELGLSQVSLTPGAALVFSF